MSTIAPSLHPAPGQLPGPLQASVEPTPTATQQNFTPLWLVRDPASQNSFQSLGMRMPNAPGDIAALLSQVSLNLELTVEEGRKNSTIAGLASLAAALSAFGLEAKREAAENLRETRDRAGETLAEVREKSAPLLSAQAAENAKIDAAKTQIAQLEARLSDPKVVGAERAQLQAQLNAARTGLDTALASREAIDIKLANVRIDSLDRQVEDVTAMLSKMEPGSEEADQAQALLTALSRQRDAAENQLEAFKSGPKTEAARNAFSHSNSAALNSATAALATRLDQYTASFATAIDDLEELTLQAMAVAANATAAYQVERQQQGIDDAGHDAAVDRMFESLIKDLKEVGDRTNAALDTTLQRLDDLQDGHRSRNIQQSALALLGALATIISAISGVDLDVPVVPTVANRFRLEI